MIMYSKKVDLRSRKEMIDFLTGHFRYNTMNSWNQSTSYAHNVKIHNLGFTREQEQKLYEMIETDEFYEYIRDILNDFSVRHRYLWRVGSTEGTAGTLYSIKGTPNPLNTNPFVLNAVNAIINRLARQGIANAVDVALMPESIT